MVTIRPYIMKCEKNRVNKENYLYSRIGTHIFLPIEGIFKETCDILNPVIVIDRRTSISDSSSVIHFNYCYIEEFSRYYFVENVVVVNNTLIELYLKVDVLYTYLTYLLETGAYISRNENEYNPYLDDNELIVQSNERVEIDTINIDLFDTSTEDGVDMLRYLITLTNVDEVTAPKPNAYKPPWAE